MKINIRYFLFLAAVAFSQISHGQNHIYVSSEGVRKLLRVNLGYTQWRVSPADSASRSARGIHLSNEVKIVSGFTEAENDAIAIHDAFYLDIDFGALSDEPHIVHWSLTGAEKESKFSLCNSFGYLALVGYRKHKWAALGGADIKWGLTRVGGLRGHLARTVSLVIRGEYGFSETNSNRRAILTGWSTLRTQTTPSLQSVRFELPLGGKGRWWLFGQYTSKKIIAEDVFRFLEPADANFRQLVLGIRIGSFP